MLWRKSTNLAKRIRWAFLIVTSYTLPCLLLLRAPPLPHESLLVPLVNTGDKPCSSLLGCTLLSKNPPLKCGVDGLCEPPTVPLFLAFLGLISL